MRPELGLGQGLTFGKLAKVLALTRPCLCNRARRCDVSACQCVCARVASGVTHTIGKQVHRRSSGARMCWCLKQGQGVQAIIKLAIRFRFRLPAYYTLIVRSLCSLEGVALRIDPEFSIVNAAIPIILRRMLTDTRPAAVSLLRELLLEEGGQLRIGMLEGLLRNYSVEAGKGSASESPASGVVLQMDGVREPGSNGASRNGAAVHGNGVHAHGKGVIAHARASNGNGTSAHVAAAGVGNGSSNSNGRGWHPSGMHADAVEAVRGNGAVRIRNEARQRSDDLGSAVLLPAVRSTDEESQVVERGASVGVATRNGAQQHSQTSKVTDSQSHSVPEPASGVQESEALSFEATVLQMVLSARASGVRRVLLESNIQVCA